MTGLAFIKSKQQIWAGRKALRLVGGTIPDRGEKNYLHNLTDNLFEPLSKGSLYCYNSGDGKETRDSRTRLAKMKCLYSSSAIVVNLFQYWEKNVYPISYTCGLTSKYPPANGILIDNNDADKTKSIIRFEEKFEISGDKSEFPYAPNIDVVIEGLYSFVYAIESKFSEPYNKGKHKGIKQKYIDNTSFWTGIPNLYELAKEICPNNNKFRYLDAAQLIKHILGLKRRYGKNGFCLLYLWYDVIGEDSCNHRKEIEQFAEIAKRDNIKFRHITYQEVMIKLSKEFYEGNENYCDYLTNRYL